jgi:hypothetical protein
MQDAKTATTPLYGAMMKRQEDTTKEDKQRKTLYPQIVGSLMWCAMSARPDIFFAVGYLSRFSSNPFEQLSLQLCTCLTSFRGLVSMSAAQSLVSTWWIVTCC